MNPYQLHIGDCLDIMPTLSPPIHAIITDPPYGIDFMGKDWDQGVPTTAYWRAALDLVQPGAHLLAFGGTRKWHRLAVAIEDAGWDIRDCIMWVYASGFPKSLDVGKAVDKHLGAERVPTGIGDTNTGMQGGNYGNSGSRDRAVTLYDNPATDEARRWDGWGTNLKPAWEPIIVARKPLAEGNVAKNVLKHEAGAINIDATRIPFANAADETESKTKNDHSRFGSGARGQTNAYGEYDKPRTTYDAPGRWPANLVHDGSPEVLNGFPTSESRSQEPTKSAGNGTPGSPWTMTHTGATYDDAGSSARFFYCAKANAKDRGEHNNHPTVKPTDLMRWLARLVCPPGGTILDPFMGSGSTGKAAIMEGMKFIGIELDPETTNIATQRLQEAAEQPRLI